jgi:hypothetical protein
MTVESPRLQHLRDLRAGLVDRQRKSPELAGQIELLIAKVQREIEERLKR